MRSLKQKLQYSSNSRSGGNNEFGIYKENNNGFCGIYIFRHECIFFKKKFDGSGAENTADVKLISLAIWLGFYLLVLAIEYGVRFLTRIGKK